MTARQPATIITFYSYKGGTGRSMALANFAWILALQGNRVLAIDWDVEAPGLHRYFRPFLIDKDLRDSPGVIDFIVAFAGEAVKPADSSLSTEWYVDHADISDYAITLEWDFPGRGSLEFVPAGRQDATYATRVSTFSWQNFYEGLGGGALIDAMRKVLREKDEYDYVLIDSRTGVSDTAGICTVQLPDKLVTCFTYNNQSTDGAAAIAASAQEQRRRPEYARGGLTELVVYPVPMRVDPFESDRLKVRQEYAWAKFDPILPSDAIPPSLRRTYWTEAEVPYIPAFSYEEQLTVFRDEPADPKSILAAFLRIAGYVIGPDAAKLPATIPPDARPRVQAEFAQTAGVLAVAPARSESAEEAAARRAETVYQRLPVAEQQIARRLFLAMVRVTEAYETTNVSGFRIREDDLVPEYRKVADVFIDGGVLIREDAYIAIGAVGLFLAWPRLSAWIDESNKFLVWRQRLRPQIEAYRSGKSIERLRGGVLGEAVYWEKEKGEDLLPFELLFIEQSKVTPLRSGWWALAVIGVVFALALFPAYFMSRTATKPKPPSQSATRAEELVKKALSLDDPLQMALVLAEVKTEPLHAKDYLATAQKKLAAIIPRVILRHTEAVWSGSYSPDETLLLTAARDGVRLWGSSAGDLRASLSVANDEPNFKRGQLKSSPNDTSDTGATFYPSAAFIDSNTIAAVGDGGKALIFDASTGGVIRKFGPIVDPVLAGVDPLHRAAVYYSMRAKTIHLIPVDHSKSADRLLPWEVGEAALSATGEMAILGGEVVYLFSTFSASPVRVASVASPPALAFSGDGSRLFMAAGDSVSVYDVRTRTLSKASYTLRLPKESILAFAANQSGDVLALGTDSGNVLLVRGGAKTELKGHREAIFRLHFSPDDQTLITTSLDKTARVWPVTAPKVIPTTFTGIAESIGERTTACLTAEERSLLLGETAATAQKNAANCEQQHGRVPLTAAVSADASKP